MRVYAIADIHGDVTKLELISRNIARYKPDAMVIAGDITHFRKADQFLQRIAKLPIPVLAVRGNTDRVKVERFLGNYHNITSLHLKDFLIKDVRFVGVSGTVLLPFRSKVALFERHILKEVDDLVNENTVLVAHPPPRKILDRARGVFHVGSSGVRKLILNKRPLLFVCGHVHENPGKMNLGHTLVVNCTMHAWSEGAIIDFVENKPLVTMLERERVKEDDL